MKTIRSILGAGKSHHPTKKLLIKKLVSFDSTVQTFYLFELFLVRKEEIRLWHKEFLKECPEGALKKEVCKFF